jgi:hypothetical protein
MRNRLAVVFALALLVGALPVTSTSAQVFDTDVTYTTDADFDQGTLVSVNHDAPYDDQLQLDSPTEPFPFINVAASGRGTVVRVNTDTGEVVGEYRTAPEGRGLNPSRTTVDLFGSVWTANREEVDEIGGVPHGSAVKIGLIAGGTRVDADGTPDPAGEYLAPPFGYSTCSDRDGDGLIHTSSGLDTVLDWPDITDGLGGSDGLVEDAVDECVLIYQRLPDAEQARHVSVDADNNVWVGGFPFDGRMFYKLDGLTGAILDSFDSRDFGCGGYGGLIDGNGVLWSIGGGSGEGPLLRYDPATRTGMCVNTHGGYGLGIDTNGYLWASLWNNGIAKVSPDGVLQPGFPKSTWPTSTAAAAAFSPTEREPLQAMPAMAMAMLQQAEELAFQVSPKDDWVQSSGTWPAGSIISLTIEDGSGVVYTDSQTADVEGFFNFHFGGMFDLQRGHVVTVSDGTTTKVHTVEDLFVDGVNVTADTVFGRADPGVDVDVWVDGYDGLTVTPDGSGNWTADFSGLVDITVQSSGGSQQSDADGDSTYVWWSHPSFQLAPQDDWVQSQNPWVSGSTITLTIEDGSGVVYTDTQTADGSGHFNFHFGGMFNLQRGHVVTVSDGTTTKVHTVEDLFVDGVNVTADTVFGRADPFTDVDVWVHGNGNATATADGSGNWIADFSGMADLTYASDGGSQQWDIDGDSTGVWWSSPKFQAHPDNDWVQSISPWTPGANITLTIDDGGAGYTDTQTADGSGHFNFGLLEVFDLQRGHHVTVSDGTTTKTHTVIDLFADTVDVGADTVTGRADADTVVNVWIHGEGSNVSATADPIGEWIADFSGVADVTHTTEGGAEQSDVDGDSTGVEWFSPRFQVQPDDDGVGSWSGWTPGATISLSIKDDVGTELYTNSTTTDSSGHFWFGLRDLFDVERGHVVTVADVAATKTHTVKDLFITDVDTAADIVSGTAAPGSEVEVQIHGEDQPGQWVTAHASTGIWSADFSGAYDLRFNTEVSANQYDGEGDVTWVRWHAPVFRVAPDTDQLWGSGWIPDAPLAVSIDDGIDVYTTTATTDAWGDFNFNIWDFDVLTDHVITISDGSETKVHTVTAVTVAPTGIDFAADTITGTAEPYAWVQVNVGLFHEGADRWLQADSSGGFVADFSVPADGQPSFDITEATFVDVHEYDDDGDATYRQFGPPVMANRGVAVTPIDNHVWVASSGIDAVTRLDNDGNVLKIIPTGDEPTGVAVDAAGKVWVTNQFSDNTVRIDPSAGTDGLGAIDLTVDLGPGASPYNYSDMTGAVVIGSTSPQGFWNVVQDSGEADFEWGRLTWNTEPEAQEPAGTEIVVEARTSDAEAGLGGATFLEVVNGELFSSFGRYIEVRVTLKASPGGLSPILSDIRVQPAIIEVPVDIKPTSCPNPFNVGKRGVMSVAILGIADFDVSQIDPTSVMLEGVAPLSWSLEDVATPYEPYLGKAAAYDCNELGPDGDEDLTLKFDALELAAAVGDVTDGDVLVLTLTGYTMSDIPVLGEDVVIILKKKNRN